MAKSKKSKSAGRAGEASPPTSRPGGRALWAIVLLCFFLLCAWLRRLTFLQSVADWDESVYLLVARSWTEGHVPYTAVLDNKPPGIYAIFALALATLGASVSAIRWITCLAIALTATGLFAIARRMEPRTRWAGAFAGFLFAVAAFEPAANTEYFFVPFTTLMTLGLIRAVRGEPAWPSPGAGWGWAGLAAGVALQIKYLAAIEVLPLAALALLHAGPPSGSAVRPLVHRLRALAVFALAAAVPALLVVAGFAASGHLGDYVHANVTMNRALAGTIRHHPGELLQRTAVHLREFWLLWCLAGAGVVAAWTRRAPSADRFAVRAAALWLACALAGVIAMGARYHHYFVELHAPLALWAGLGAGAGLAWVEGAGAGRARAGLARRALASALALGLAASAWWFWNAPWQRSWRIVTERRRATGDPHWGDDQARLAAYLLAEMKRGDALYVVDGQPILYFLTGTPVPTRFAFPPLLVDTTLNRVAGVDAERELRSILARAPRFLVRSRPGTNAAFYRRLDPWMARFYEIDRRSPVRGLFRLRGGAEDSLRAAARGPG